MEVVLCSDETFQCNLSFSACENMLSSNIYWIYYLGRGQGASRLGQW